MRSTRRAVAVCAFALAMTAGAAARAEDNVRGLIQENGAIRFNGFRIEKNVKQDPPQHGGIPLDQRTATAIMLPPPDAKRKVIVDMTIRYDLPEISIPKPTAP